MIPAVALAIIIGTKNGLTRSGPFSRYSLTCSSSVMSPPMPVPVMTPPRAGSTPGSPASASASAAAAKPICRGAVDAPAVLRAEVRDRVEVAHLAAEPHRER